MRRTALTSTLVLTCADCGHKTLVDMVMVPAEEVPRDDLTESMQRLLDADAGGRWGTEPDVVTCEQCRAQYATHGGDDEADPS